MTDYPTLGYRLPRRVATRLYGDRARFGREIQKGDPDWDAWQRLCPKFYLETQKRGVGELINDAGYRILRGVDLEGRRVLEIGAGTVPHVRFWRGRPSEYSVVDVNRQLLDLSLEALCRQGIDATAFLSESVPDAGPRGFDVVLAFYSLEHLAHLDGYLTAIERVLNPGGIVAGAIPTEGGLAWGIGRFLTTRRYIRRHCAADTDKILCWEHPNFADAVMRALDRRFEPVKVDYWPFGVPLVDINLVVRFVYRRSTA